jgi:hypothetical protein
MDKCSKCGQKKTAQDRFCANCGHDISGNTKNLVGKWLSGSGCLFALSPIAMAILFTPIGGNIFSEGSGGGGAALWALLLTLPLGAIVSIVGIVLWAANKRK